jgi:hypothetical protein
MAKRYGSAVYGMRAGKATAAFQVAAMAGHAKAEVIGEGRTLEAGDGIFRDTFEPWDVHLYKITAE